MKSRHGHAPTRIEEDDYPVGGSSHDRLVFLLRYALLAPSSHNSQPWLFHLSDDVVDLHADLSRWLRVADNDQRELYLSLGCALENLVIAAEHFGCGCHVELLPDPSMPEWAARVTFQRREEGLVKPSADLFPALEERRTTLRPFTGENVPEDTLGRLRQVVTDEGVRLLATNDQGIVREVEGLVVQGDRLQLSEPAYRRELGEWIGSGALGWPRGLRQVAGAMVGHLDLSRPVARWEAGLMESAGGIAVVVSDSDDPLAQLHSGRALERTWLLATRLGLAVQPMSGPVEVPVLRARLGHLMGAGDDFPQHLFRLGYGEPGGWRRPRLDLGR